MIASFAARTVHGSGRGKGLGVPTLNVDLRDVPSSLEHGIYACFVTVDNERMMGALHYGPRPVFEDTDSCEVHILDRDLSVFPASVHMDIVERLRDVQDFSSPQALTEQIIKDTTRTRAILESL